MARPQEALTEATEHLRPHLLPPSMYDTIIQTKRVTTMTEKPMTEDSDVKVETQVTLCPECGTEWETVVTRRRVTRRRAEIVQD